MEYPKIHSLFKRDPETHKFTTEYSKPEFSNPNAWWHVEEKIDGMNMRIYIDNGKITAIQGRTDAAMIPSKLLAWINRPELAERIATLETSNHIILYGEGFGTGIQSGGNYRKDQAFILFDCYAGGRWSTREELGEIAQHLDLQTPASLPCMDSQEAIAFIKSKPNGHYGLHPLSVPYPMEGVICRSYPLVRFNDRSANPVMFKLKVKDFE